MEQTRALNALEPFLALSKSATGPRAAADLITQATSNPNTYVFAELLNRPQIQALSESPEHAPFLALLKLFSYGTYDAYTSAASSGNLPPLNEAQTLKLRQLSLLTLARDPQMNLRYDVLQQQLGLEDSRSLEDLVITAVYAGLLEAQLDPRNQTVHVSSVAPLRDLAPGSIPGMLASLREWSGRCEATLSTLESQMAEMRADAERRAAEKNAWEAKLAKVTDADADTHKGAGEGAGASGSVHGRNQANMVSRAVNSVRAQQRYNKRGSVEANVGEDDEEGTAEGAMDVDDEDDEGGAKKRSSRRKI